MINNTRDISKFINELEHNYDLFNKTIDNIYFWKLIRMDIFTIISQRNNIQLPDAKMTIYHKIIRILRHLCYSGHNVFKKKKIQQKKFAILTAGRRMNFNGKKVEPALYDFMKNIKNREDYLIIDRPDFDGNHSGDYLDNFDYIYFERFSQFIRFTDQFKKINFDFSTMNLLRDIENDIFNHTNHNINLIPIIAKKLNRFKREKKHYYKLLQHFGIVKIFLVISYGKEDLISACNDLKIEVVEFQHGLISDFHLGYSFNNNEIIHYFPDQIILFGDYWKEHVTFPNNVKLIVSRFEFFSQKFEFTELAEHMIVLFISQGTIGLQLSNLAVEFSKTSKYRVIYKLHPNEKSIWKSKYRSLYLAFKNNLLEVIEDNYTVADLMRTSKYVVGVYSTSLFEALNYGIPTFSIKISGFENIEKIASKGIIKILDMNFKDKDLELNEYKRGQYKSYFFK